MNDYTIYLLAQQREAELQRKLRDRQRLERACEVALPSTQAGKQERAFASLKRWLGAAPNLNTASPRMSDVTD